MIDPFTSSKDKTYMELAGKIVAEYPGPYQMLLKTYPGGFSRLILLDANDQEVPYFNSCEIEEIAKHKVVDNKPGL